MSVTAAAGFRAAAATAGLKASGTPDVALVVNDGPRHDAAAVFTSNRCKANPVLWTERTITDGRLRAVVLNSGGANCYNGPEGFQTTHSSAELVGELLDGGAFDVGVCSTGMIGPLLDREKLESGIRSAHDALSTGDDAGTAAATAIMTTDTRPKQAASAGDGWTVGGMAKGAGMLAPGLATMLVVITTDAVVDAPVLDAALREATRTTFDRLDTDGCMSTNDTVILMASGASGVEANHDALAASVTAVCADLTAQLWTDAEGAHHDIEIVVTGAASDDDAVTAGRAVARSNLFKAAVFGKDPNWGRVLAAVGTTDAVFDPHDITVTMNGVMVCRAGGTEAGDPVDDVDMSGRHLRVGVDLGAGEASATILTSDLTHEYVHENSAYST
ncbi:bifunctional glutamate N-acetyltransferase/amino-acid acetyltransferase ArgJ [Actinobacteria bacterium YIM 96077]|uniref:Arginine biosynthesis bifunctional protein ArgJ n=1 Tax=Phytoactinopolyspora halophila TaxID=1981511 RepID=A0A329QFT5_9ACTN|nr:bifunctional glutamate N-acetyltransferase/amino-acid acetyltransferase ArgJ [Phytoactinopolyspora halophila]AYY13630.1 bifunctional glutamate N-acetyltransferase/amino-acid acetyltransferase ArgJ [Actinobacteria bacterium YIM 96077]RAW11194.1 bifunctional ornithine acetyltransferase/N-acetylglutamate synthase [Phytoactinopolyspora halophila]